MNKDRFEGSWKEFKGKIKEKWGKLTDNDLTQINGKYDQFLGALQKRYGYEKDRAEKEFNGWNWGERKEGRSFESRQKEGDLERIERKAYEDDRMNRDSSPRSRDEDTYKGRDREEERSEKERTDVKNKNKRPFIGREKEEDNRDKKRKAG